MKIKQLQLHNFKFFTDEDNILNFNSKNVLIWGENGSGKSSIYWAIYTLLQCSFKDKQGIDAYFTVNHEKNLLNIHRAPDADAFIEMELDNGNKYKIALGEDSIVGNQDMQLSAVSSDFIDYKVVASLLDFWHKDEPNVYPIFEEQILRFLPFKSPAPFSDEFFDQALVSIFKGPPQDAITKKYSTTGSTAYDQYINLLTDFNRQFTEEIGLINIRANKLLQDDKVFNYDIEIELVYEPLTFDYSANRTKIKFIAPKIILFIRNYYGIPDAVKRPQSFLNEAKKTAIGLAVRLAILERRLLDEKLNVLALDDLLISLDMSNREVVLKLLFDEYQEKYQLLIFTHDKQFFNIAKNKIENKPYKEDWLFWEFYVNDEDQKLPKPRYFETKTQISIAYRHLQANDYPAAANYLRKQCEYLIETFLPQYCFRDINKDKSHKNYPLDSMLSNSILFLDRIHQLPLKNNLIEIRQYVEMLLNPLSHTERGVDSHKGEIKTVIKILEELEPEFLALKFKKMPIVPVNSELTLTLIKDVNNKYEILLKLKEDLFLYEAASGVKLSNCLIDSVYYKHYENLKIKSENKFEKYTNKELEQSYNEITLFPSIAIPVIPNWESLFTKTDGTPLNTLMVL